MLRPSSRRKRSRLLHRQRSGFRQCERKVILAPSRPAGILGLKTTSVADHTTLKLVAAALDSKLNYVAPQPIEGGHGSDARGDQFQHPRG